MACDEALAQALSPLLARHGGLAPPVVADGRIEAAREQLADEVL